MSPSCSLLNLFPLIERRLDSPLTDEHGHICKALGSSIIARSVPLLSRGHVCAHEVHRIGSSRYKICGCPPLTGRNSNSIVCEHQPSPIESINMFIRAFTVLFSVVALAGLAIAAPGGGGSSQCDTGSIQCCSSYQSVRFPSSTLVIQNTEGSFTIVRLPVHFRVLRVHGPPFALPWHPGRVYVLPDHRRRARFRQHLHLPARLLQRRQFRESIPSLICTWSEAMCTQNGVIVSGCNPTTINV